MFQSTVLCQENYLAPENPKFLNPKSHGFKNITDELIKNSEAAAVLSCAPSYLKLSRHTGLLFGVKAPEHIRMGKRSIRYRRSTLVNWLSQFVERPNTSA